LMYIVNSTFYKSKVGTLCLEQNTFKQWKTLLRKTKL
jgi:hypothetical protein